MALTPLRGWKVKKTEKAICPLGDTVAGKDGTEGTGQQSKQRVRRGEEVH